MDKLTSSTIAYDKLDFRHCNILVIGDVMLDQYWLGSTSRISPEAPIPILKVSRQNARLGGAANAGLNAKALDAKVAIAGIIGNDPHGKELISLLDCAGIDNHCIISDDDQTITKLRMISQNQQMLRADFEQPFSANSITRLTDKLVDNLAPYDVIIISDYNKGTVNECQRIIEAAKRQNIPIIVDPKGNDYSRYQGASLLTPNLKEFEAIAGPCKNRSDLVAQARILIDKLALDALLITLSEHGMALCLANGNYFHFNALAKEVYDVTGAGDTVIATLSTAIAAGMSMQQAVNLANTAASLVVSHLGAAQVSTLELKMALEERSPSSKAILDLGKLKTMVNFEKNHGKRIVFTNGCFDILHKGHTTYLSEAKALGDRLIVAVNDDNSIRKLKGENRPINSLDDRMSLLASLESVDFVIPFTEDTPCNLLRELQPDILVKGGDYGINDVVGIDVVKEYGGEVKVLSLQTGRSTTQIIDTIKKTHE